jgi:RimJ/RimL family protein N-acetyltransferase
MKLLPLDTPRRIELAADWLARKENHQWLDFGSGRQVISPALLKIMTQRETHFLRLYTAEGDDTPIGVLGLNSVDRVFKSATFWGASGDKSFRYRGTSTFASSRFLTLAFRDLGLHSVNTWVVDGNPSRKIIERLGFRCVGTQRQCHLIECRLRDRLLYDLLACEHQELDETRWRRVEESHRKEAREACATASG